MSEKRYKNLKEFYPFYLGEHLNPVCRSLHVVGTGLTLALLAYFVITQNYQLIWICLVSGYAFAWVGHFFFEKNQPATFKYPLFSLISDFILFFDVLTGRQKINPRSQLH
ncbi:MAG: DUF962 domain-containing protein [Pseudomonadota bacterium]